MSNLQKIPDLLKARAFWNWFQRSHNKYLFIHDIQDDTIRNEMMSEFLVRLHQYCDALFYKIGGHPEDERIELIITAEGDREYFDYVETLIATASVMKDWHFVAFKPPMGKGFKLEVAGKLFDASKILFIPLHHENNPTAVGLDVCYPDYTEKERNLFVTGTYLSLDSLIGEKATTLDIDFLDVIRTPDNIADYDFRHLEDIQEYIDEIKGTH